MQKLVHERDNLSMFPKMSNPGSTRYISFLLGVDLGVIWLLRYWEIEFVKFAQYIKSH
jgi:hypothetical protein